MATHEFPRYGGGQELTAAQVNAMLDQVRRQARIYAVQPLEAVQTPAGWTIRLKTNLGFWARITGQGSGSGGGPRYSYEEVYPDQSGEWYAITDQPPGEADDTGLSEANDTFGVEIGTVVWVSRTPSRDATAMVFTAPTLDASTAPDFIWAKVQAFADGSYDYVPLEYQQEGFIENFAGYQSGSAFRNSKAQEVNGSETVPVDTIVLMRLLKDVGQVPLFSVASIAAGFVARKQTYFAPRVVNVSLDGELGDTPPTGGTWTFSIQHQGGVLLETSSGELQATATAAEVQAEVEAMTTFLYGSVMVTDGATGGWDFTFQNDLARFGGVQIHTSNLEYDSSVTPNNQTYGIANGLYAQQVLGTTSGGEGGDPVWVEVERSTAGSWYTARDAKTARKESVTPANPIVSTESYPDGIVALLEPSGKTLVGGSVLPTIHFTNLLDADDLPLTAADAYVTPDGAAAIVTVNAAGGTFTLTHFATTAPIAWDATASDVADAINAALIAGGFTAENGYATVSVTGSAGPLPGAIRLAWSDPAGDDSVAKTIYTYEHHNPPSVWAGGTQGLSGLKLTGTLFNEIWELRTYYPGGDGGIPTGGTITLSYGDTELGDLNFDAAFQDVQDLIEPTVGRGNVTCSGGPLPAPIRIEFTGDLAATETDGLSITADALTVDGDVAATPEIFLPASRVIRTHGATAPTFVEGLTGFTVTESAQTTAANVPAVTTGAMLATNIGNTLTSVGGPKHTILGSQFLTGQGGFGGPWRLVFKGTLAKEAPPNFAFAVASPATYTVTQADGTALGVSKGPDGGTVKFCFGAMWQLTLNGLKGSSVTLNFGTGGSNFTLTWGMTPPQVIAAMGTNIVGNFNGVQNLVAVNGGPLGTAPMFFDVSAWPCNRTISLTVVSTGYSAPTVTPTMTCVLREEFSNDAAVYEIAAVVQPTGGTWTFTNMLNYSPTTNTLVYAPPALPWNATASQVQSVVRSYTYEASGPPFLLRPQPFANAVCSGGPLPGTPILIRVPTGYTEPWRQYRGTQNTYPLSGVNTFTVLNTTTFAPDAALLTGTPASHSTTATVTWLGTSDIPVTSLTATRLQSELNGTSAGLGAVCKDREDGGIDVSLPTFSGPPTAGNPGSRFSALGYADGGHLSFWYNSAPRDGFFNGASTDFVTNFGVISASNQEINSMWGNDGAPYNVPFRGSSPAGRVDPIAEEAMDPPMRAVVIRDVGVTPTALSDNSPALYKWVEIKPGTGRCPRDWNGGFLYYDGPEFGTNLSAEAATGTGFGNSFRFAKEASGNVQVPDGTEIWLDPIRGYAFRWDAPVPTPRYGRVYGSQFLLEADPATNPLANSGAVTAVVAPTGASTSGYWSAGRYYGLYPDIATGTTAPVTWTTPIPDAQSPTVIDMTRDTQQLGTGHKVVSGSLFLWERQGDARATLRGGDSSVPFGGMGKYTGAIYSQQNAIGTSLLGRSVRFVLDFIDTTQTATVTLGSWGSFGPFGYYSPVVYIQSLVDALLGPGNCWVYRGSGNITNPGSIIFFFGWGAYSRMNPGTITATSGTLISYGFGGTGLDPANAYSQGSGIVWSEATSCSSLPTTGGYLWASNSYGSTDNPYTATFTIRSEILAAQIGPRTAGTYLSAYSAELQVTTGAPLTPNFSYQAGRRMMTSADAYECGEGIGYPACSVGTYNYSSEGAIYNSTPFNSTFGNHFAFGQGICVEAFGDTTGNFTGTFPTRAGLTVTVVNGWIMSVA
jgi:hypothetical protein